MRYILNNNNSTLSFNNSALTVTTALWTPAQISTAAWYDASDASTITLSISGVSQWNDKSGNNNNLTQATLSAQPTYSNNEITFGYLGTGNTFTLRNTTAVNMLASTGCSSFIAVHKLANALVSNAASFNIFSVLSNATSPLNRRPLIGYRRSNNSLQFYNGTASVLTANVQFATTGMVGNNAIIGFLVDGVNTDSFGYLNGALFASDTVQVIDTNTSFNSISIGNLIGQVGVNITFSEVIFIPSCISTIDRQKIEGYLAHKWGLSNLLPVSHPYRNIPPLIQI